MFYCFDDGAWQAERAEAIAGEAEWQLTPEEEEMLTAVRHKKKLMRQEGRFKKNKNSAIMPRKTRSRNMEDVSVD